LNGITFGRIPSSGSQKAITEFVVPKITKKKKSEKRKGSKPRSIPMACWFPTSFFLLACGAAGTAAEEVEDVAIIFIQKFEVL
jgi:hypothetical protein